MKVKLVLLILFIVLVGGIYVVKYGKSQYKDSDRTAYKASTSNCLMLGISDLLNDYFVREGHYPTQDIWEDYVLDNGYPDQLGCGPTSLKGKGKVIDAMESPVIYEYVSATEVYIFSRAMRSQQGKVFHLISGEMKPAK